jgi:hypothetical protein
MLTLSLTVVINFSNACTYISLRCASLKIWLYALCTSGVRIVETAGRPPNEFISRFKEKDIKIIHKCVTTRHAKSAEKSGVDAISLDGFECAGHPGEEVIHHPALSLSLFYANISIITFKLGYWEFYLASNGCERASRSFCCERRDRKWAAIGGSAMSRSEWH